MVPVSRSMPQTAGEDATGHQAAAERGGRRRPASERELAVLPAPEPSRVQAARNQLIGHYAADGDGILWVTAGPPLLDLRAVSTVLEAAHRANGQHRRTRPADAQARDGQVGALDLGAALIVLAALRLDIDRLEADLMDEVLRAGLGQEFIASALGIPVPQAMKRHRLLGERRNSPTDGVPRAASPPAAQHP
jgi:hypothetical protein